jgi:hypothetical protein
MIYLDVADTHAHSPAGKLCHHFHQQPLWHERVLKVQLEAVFPSGLRKPWQRITLTGLQLVMAMCYISKEVTRQVGDLHTTATRLRHPHSPFGTSARMQYGRWVSCIHTMTTTHS